jgi:hypothetical protein
MATLSQIEANRRNAQKPPARSGSTGPRTPEGKAVSSMNALGPFRALQSGLEAESQFVVGEDRSDFAQLQHEYITRFQPATPEERFQIDTLLRNEWVLRRLFRAEAQLWEYFTLRADRSEGVSLGEALVAGNEPFRRLQRRITLAERSYKDAFAELERLQRGRRSLAAAPTSAESDNPIAPNPSPNPGTTELASFFHPSASSVAGSAANGVETCLSGHGGIDLYEAAAAGMSSP